MTTAPGLDAPPPQLPEPVHDPACGQHRDSAGRPRTGWVRVNIAGQPATWYCSLPCAAAGLTALAEPASTVARPDVGNCPTCAARHDIGHRCRSCGHVPAMSGYHWRGGRR